MRINILFKNIMVDPLQDGFPEHKFWGTVHLSICLYLVNIRINVWRKCGETSYHMFVHVCTLRKNHTMFAVIIGTIRTDTPVFYYMYVVCWFCSHLVCHLNVYIHNNLTISTTILQAIQQLETERERAQLDKQIMREELHRTTRENQQLHQILATKTTCRDDSQHRVSDMIMSLLAGLPTVDFIGFVMGNKTVDGGRYMW